MSRNSGKTNNYQEPNLDNLAAEIINLTTCIEVLEAKKYILQKMYLQLSEPQKIVNVSPHYNTTIAYYNSAINQQVTKLL